MRVHTYLSRSCLLVLVAASLGTLAGCGSNQSLGGGEPSDAAVASGGAGGTTGVTTVTGATTASTTAAGGATVAGISAGGVSSSAGMTANAGRTSTASTSTGGATVAGGTTAVAGNTATGGASTGGTTATAGSTAIAGNTATGGASTGGTTATGGSIGTGGSAAGGTSATGGTGAGGSTGGAVGGVSLVAELYATTDWYIKASWRNGSSASIFLYGCGTVDVYKQDASEWKNLGKTLYCAWEGISPEVKAGTTYTDDSPAYGPVYRTWGAGTYRVAGTYGVGCTDPSAGQSKAGCTAFYEATSNEITVTAPPASADAGVDGACGNLPDGVTCKKPTGGCAAMTCVSASWTCAPGQTPAAVVPGVCDTIAPDAGTGG